MQITEHVKKLQDWWNTPLGKSFIEAEGIEIKPILSKLFGYHLLILGESRLAESVTTSPITHKVWIDPFLSPQKDVSALTGRIDKLPILSDSIDVIYLAHCLEYIKNPHEVLRESYRALIPEGHLIISHFNPWSLWGLWRWIVRYLKPVPWDGHFMSLTRLKDWLALLGFDIDQQRFYFFRPPITNEKFLSRISFLEKLGAFAWPIFGGGYIIIARKRVSTLTPIRPVWQTAPKEVVPEIIEPARTE